MASRHKEHSPGGKYSLGCTMCEKPCPNPQKMDCDHSFCSKCLQELQDKQDPGSREFQCPCCERKSIILDGGGDQLSEMVEKIRIQGKIQEQDSKIECEACNDKTPAVSKCMDCDDYLCQECQRAHERMKLMKDHTLIPLQSREPTSLSKPSMKCKTHSNQDVIYFCDTCQILACLKCSVKDHLIHSLVNLKEALQKCKQEVAELVVKVENNNSELNDACDAMEKSCKKLDIMFANTKEKISKKAEKEIAKAVGRIREEEQKLKQTAEENYKDRVKSFKQALTQNFNVTTQTKSKLDEVNLVIPHLNDTMIEYIKNKLLNNLDEMSAVKAENVSDMLSFMDFEESEDSLGRLVLAEKPLNKPQNTSTGS